MTGQVMDDPELGPVRWCSGCADWWPLDDEFFYIQTRLSTASRPFTTYQCRACHIDRMRRDHIRRGTRKQGAA